MQMGNHQDYAGFWIRVFASIIDSALMMLLIVPLLIAFYGMNGDSYLSNEQNLWLDVWDFTLNFILPAVIVILFWVYKSATPGKFWLKLKIIDQKSGLAPTLKQYIIRYLGYFLASLPLFLGIIWVAFDKRKQGLHDKLAGTAVVISSAGDFGVTTRRGISHAKKSNAMFMREH